MTGLVVGGGRARRTGGRRRMAMDMKERERAFLCRFVEREEDALPLVRGETGAPPVEELV